MKARSFVRVAVCIAALAVPQLDAQLVETVSGRWAPYAGGKVGAPGSLIDWWNEHWKSLVAARNGDELARLATDVSSRLRPDEAAVFDVYVTDLGPYGVAVMGIGRADQPALLPGDWRLARKTDPLFTGQQLTVRGYSRSLDAVRPIVGGMDASEYRGLSLPSLEQVYERGRADLVDLVKTGPSPNSGADRLGRQLERLRLINAEIERRKELEKQRREAGERERQERESVRREEERRREAERQERRRREEERRDRWRERIPRERGSSSSSPRHSTSASDGARIGDDVGKPTPTPRPDQRPPRPLPPTLPIVRPVIP
ncbi:MAG: hypothetical protein IPK85_06845 [Gemmatimonadetes bacterium]|nr:hypothetical protein [Gemmatimonadota bacterium]